MNQSTEQQLKEFKEAVGLIKKQSKLGLLECTWFKSQDPTGLDYCSSCDGKQSSCDYYRPYLLQ